MVRYKSYKATRRGKWPKGLPTSLRSKRTNGIRRRQNPLVRNIPGIIRSTIPFFDPARQQMLRTKMVYSAAIAMNSDILTAAWNIFRLNSIHDPDLTSLGHQPLFYDQWLFMFRNYMVYGCKVTCTIQNQTIGTNPIQFAMLPSGGESTSFYTNKQLKEIPIQKGVTVVQSLNFGSTKTIVKYYDTIAMRALEGDGSTAMNSVQSTAFGSNPANDLLLHIVIKGLDETIPNVKALVRITLEYYVQLQDVIEETPSS